MAAHVAYRPALSFEDDQAGSFLVCREHDLRQPFGRAHSAACAARTAHNSELHA